MWLVGCKLFAHLLRWSFDAAPDNEVATIVGFIISVVLSLVFFVNQIDDNKNSNYL
jgi:hypothetical protein